MDDRLRQQLEQILRESEAEGKGLALIRQALKVDIPIEDAWLRGVFRMAAGFLKQVYGEEANQVIPWLIFSLGVAYERGDRDELYQS